MLSNRFVYAVSVLLLAPSVSVAQSGFRGFEACGRVLGAGIKNYSVSTSSDYALKIKHDAYCDGKTVKVNVDTKADFSIPLEGVPVPFNGTGKGSFEDLK